MTEPVRDIMLGDGSGTKQRTACSSPTHVRKHTANNICGTNRRFFVLCSGHGIQGAGTLGTSWLC